MKYIKMLTMAILVLVLAGCKINGLLNVKEISLADSFYCLSLVTIICWIIMIVFQKKPSRH